MPSCAWVFIADGNDDRAKTTEAVREESEHRLISSGDTPLFALSSGGWRRGRTSAQPAEVRVSILLYDALDFSTDRDDGGGQTRESLSRIASPSAAVARLNSARFAHQVRRSRQVFRLLTRWNTARRGNHKPRPEIFFGPRNDDVKKNGRTSSRSAAVNSTYRRQKMRRHLPPNYRLRLIVS